MGCCSSCCLCNCCKRFCCPCCWPRDTKFEIQQRSFHDLGKKDNDKEKKKEDGGHANPGADIDVQDAQPSQSENNREEMVKLKNEIEELQQKLESYQRKKRICIMTFNIDRLRHVALAIMNTFLQEDTSVPADKIEIIPRMLSSQSIDDDKFDNAKMAVLVGYPEGRNMLLGDGGQLESIYKKADELNLEILIIYTDNECPEENEVYHSSLEELFEQQKIVGKLAKKKRFISVKYKPKQPMLQFNKLQRELLSKWIQNPKGSESSGS